MTEPDDDLEEFFVAARRDVPRPDAALIGRIAADAERVSPARGWRGFWRAVGGWPAMASFACAAVFGVWLGSAGPPTIDALTGVEGYDLADLMPGYDTGWTEDSG